MATFNTLSEAAGAYDAWLKDAALPLWWKVGADHERGGFLEALSVHGEPRPAPRRGRAQGRQVFTYALAGELGWQGPWLEAARHGEDYAQAHFRPDDGLFRMLVGIDGQVLNDTAMLYDQVFALLGMATLHRADPGRVNFVAEAARTRQGLPAMRHPAGGFRENVVQPFQANAHMHILEAAMAWGEAGETSWDAHADEIVGMARSTFIDAEGGFFREFFDQDWKPAAGDEGRFLEPGHQFEWAWLLERWGRQRGDASARAAARKLFEIGRKGVDRVRGVVVNELWDDLSIRDAKARLWSQAEYLKAALILGQQDDALLAANGLWKYLETPARGTWFDKMRPDGSFIAEVAPASSFYHIVCAAQALL